MSLETPKNPKAPGGSARPPHQNAPRPTYTLHTLAVATLRAVRKIPSADLTLRHYMALEQDRASIVLLLEDLVDTMFLSEVEVRTLARQAESPGEDEESLGEFAKKTIPALHAAVRLGVAKRAFEIEKTRMEKWDDELGGPYYQLDSEY